MELSTTEELLIDGLILFNVARGNAMLVMMLLGTEKKRWAMLEFMLEALEKSEKREPNLTEDEIVRTAYMIAEL